ncbi:hypothetical protein [Streptomyces tsukubensis]|uniref:hypothetical protein n=1 Tax=Streptomyces tsukubensis TaxID=83656 RepID=UPI0034509432
MSLLGALMSETVQIRRPGPRVRNSTGSWVPGPPVLIPLSDCAIASPFGVVVGSSTEHHNASATVTTRRILLAPLGTDIQPDDQIVQAGRTYRVIGRPLVFHLTSLAHVEATLEEVTG